MDQVGRINSRGWQLQDRVIRVLNLILLGLLLTRLLLVRRIPFQRDEFLLLGFCTISYFTFLLLYETQPRFDIFLLIPGSYMAAQVLGFAAKPGGGRDPGPRVGSIPPVRAGAAGLMGIIAIFILGLKVVTFAGNPLADMSTAWELTDGEVRDLMPDVMVVEGRSDIAFNGVRLGLANRSGGIPPNSGTGLGLDIPVKPGNSPLLEGFLVLAPGFVTHEEDLSGLGLEVCLFVESLEARCSLLADADGAFLQLPLKARENPDHIEVRLVVVARAAIGREQVPTQPVAALEHLRVR